MWNAQIMCIFVCVCVFYSTVTQLGKFHEKCLSFEDLRTSSSIQNLDMGFVMSM